MKQMKKRNIVLCIVSFLLAFTTAMALLWTPQVEREIYPEESTLLDTLDKDDIELLNSCTIDDDGNVEITGPDAFMIFSGISESGQKIVINFGQALEEDALVELYYNERWGFNEGHRVAKQCEKGDTSVEFLVKTESYVQFRIDIDIPYQLESVEISSVKIVDTSVQTNNLWWIWALIVAVVATAVMYFVDQRYALSDYLLDKLCLLWKSFKANIFYLMGIGVLSIVSSIILTGMPRIDLYELYEFAWAACFSFSLLCAIFCLWKYRKNLVENFDKVFVILLLCVGVMLVIVAPMAHSTWDTDVHYRLALESSYLGDAKLTVSEVMIRTAKDDAWLKRFPLGDFFNMLNLTSNYQDVVESYEAGISLAHLPAGIFIALGRLFGFPFALIFMMGRLANLLVYTVVCYFGLRKLKSGKLLYSVIALFPTNVLLACSYSYDYWVTAFSLLGMAYYISVFQQKDKYISTKDAIVMCAALGLACIPKEIYVPLLIIPFILPKNRMKNPKKYYKICMIALLATAALFLVATLGETTGEGDSRGGAGISPMGQIAFIFGNIFKYAAILLKFLFVDYLNILHVDQYISNFSYIGFAGGTFIVVILLVLTFLFDKDDPYEKESRTGWRNRTYVLLMYFGGSALIATALYLVFNPVGSETIVGVQHRYIIPWLYPMLSIWSLNGIRPMIPKKILYWLVTIGCFGLLYYDIFTVVLPTVIPI